ncbi:MAG: glycosyltransferase family 2 protein [Oscillospiraceae bacterium]|jgi:glycosyltransferase involved in cell wall biosynthesis|nr:glycosyltransferase family 2 protein [Oscillospiraceae bacterium]
MKSLDVVVPCLNEGECVPLLYEAVVAVLDTLPDVKYTFYFIDDGSRDDTLAQIKTLADRWGEARVKYISFSRNFGKEAAIYAGLQASQGDLVVILDADLQHPPALLPQMIEAIEEGYDSCAARRSTRKAESPLRSMLSRAFYRLMKWAIAMDMEPNATDFRMMTRAMRASVLALPETERFSKGLFDWVGYRTKWIVFENVPRRAGVTKWSMRALLNYAISGMIAFATAPLRAAIILGFCAAGFAVVYGLYMLGKALIFGTNASGFTTIALLVMFFGGMIIVLLSIIGEYITRIYSEVKRRPIYIAKESNV